MDSKTAMTIPDEQVREFVAIYPHTVRADEAGVEYFLIPNLVLPEGRTPNVVDSLLCPSARDGYPSRMFFARRIDGGRGGNWNATDVRILERNWYAFSWKTRPDLRLAQMVAAHLDGLR